MKAKERVRILELMKNEVHVTGWLCGSLIGLCELRGLISIDESDSMRIYIYKHRPKEGDNLYKPHDDGDAWFWDKDDLQSRCDWIDLHIKLNSI